jgi:1,4-alpha-glucan branching enzyme
MGESMIKAKGPTPKAPAPAVRTGPALKSIPFAATLGEVREVLLAGDFTGWTAAALPLRKNPDGRWTALLQLAPGEYQYRLLVDGQWRDHPEAQRRVPNPFGTENCVLTVA